MRLLFAGTPDTAVPALDALIASRHDVVGVLTRPDARAGRGRKLAMSPVKERALEAGIEVLDPVAPRGEDFLADLARLDVDAAPVVAYGAILRPEVLHVPRHGWINLHFSVLPAWRGAAPVQRAIIAGDEITGATTFRIEEGLDTGPVFGTLTETIRPRDTSGVLLERLAVAGAELLVATLDAIEDGTIMAVPQPDDGVSHAPRLQPADARVDWSRPAHIVDRLIRGCTPAPGAWTTLPDGARLGLGPVRVGTPVVRGSASSDGASNGESPPLAPGEIEVRKNAVVVGTGGGVVTLGDVVPPGKRAMPAADWARGARLETGTRLGAA